MRRVEGFPVKVLWDRDGRDCNTRRLKDIVRNDADVLITGCRADIVIAQAGAPILWPHRDAILDFWRGTSKSGYYFTITAHGQLIEKSSAPTYLFYPSEWHRISEFPLVLLEMVCWPYDPELRMFGSLPPSA